MGFQWMSLCVNSHVESDHGIILHSQASIVILKLVTAMSININALLVFIWWSVYPQIPSQIHRNLLLNQRQLIWNYGTGKSLKQGKKKIHSLGARAWGANGHLKVRKAHGTVLGQQQISQELRATNVFQFNPEHLTSGWRGSAKGEDSWIWGQGHRGREKKTKLKLPELVSKSQLIL